MPCFRIKIKWNTRHELGILMLVTSDSFSRLINLNIIGSKVCLIIGLGWRSGLSKRDSISYYCVPVWSVLECFRRLLLASVVGLVAEDSTAAPVIGLYLALGFLYVFTRWTPFRNEDDNHLGIVLAYSLTREYNCKLCICPPTSLILIRMLVSFMRLFKSLSSQPFLSRRISAGT